MSKFRETRIGEDEVGAQMGMEIAPEGVRLLFGEIGFDATDGEVAATVASVVFASVRLSAASQSFCSKPMLAGLFFDLVDLVLTMFLWGPNCSKSFCSEKREKTPGYKREH